MITHSKPWINDVDRKAIDSILASGMIAQGQQVRQFEEMCARFLCVNDAVAVSSGTAALILALKALGLPEGAEVILPTYVCKNVAQAIVSTGYVPVLCDVGDEWNMTPETVKKSISNRTGAIIVVHIFGIMVDVNKFKQFRIPLIEDACQAFGAKLDNRIAGTIGDLGCFSFHATKCLTTGEGGLVVSSNRGLIERMRSLRDGEPDALLRIATPMTDLQAALGLSQLSQYNDFLKRREEISNRYFESLTDLPLELPYAIRSHSIFFRYPVQVKGDFRKICQQFADHGVQVRHGVDALLHWSIAQPGRVYPNAERLFSTTLSLPIYPALTLDNQHMVIRGCRSIFG